jgi:DNA adenine methylase
MRTPITYYGGKQLMAERIISMIPPHNIYVEPFFGGGAVFFRKKKSGLEVINDKNEMLINFYTQVVNNFPDLEKMIECTLHSEAMYHHAKDVWNNRVESNDIEKAWAIWIITNESFAGTFHGGWKWDNGSSGGHFGISFSNKRIAFNKSLSHRLSNVQISCRDALRVITDRDTVDTFFYLDPPYPGCDQKHYSGYSHKDLFELLQLLSNIKGKFILSNFWCQTIRYHVLKYGWNFQDIEMNSNVNQLGRGRSGKKTKHEFLIYNYDIPKSLFD